jgi:hypothetical protein
MKIFGFVLVASILLAPAAHAQSTTAWIAEDAGAATCDTLPSDGIASPEDLIDQIRNQGNVPIIKKINGADGTLSEVIIGFQQSNGGATGISFFKTMDGCEAQLKRDIADGSVTDPNSLR